MMPKMTDFSLQIAGIMIRNIFPKFPAHINMEVKSEEINIVKRNVTRG
jgi:hypothetical protein